MERFQWSSSTNRRDPSVERNGRDQRYFVERRKRKKKGSSGADKVITGFEFKRFETEGKTQNVNFIEGIKVKRDSLKLSEKRLIQES
jgi:hypothetical protein